ncbi:MAG: histidinol-phosphatase [Rhodospirillaceae bacterium]|jgi:inositol-phosphate phosphatase / L-galactose 1-phosphate phosphatase / histidinol-phosphatase|nr:histidinol-phosphatase [Rhodospirillaceae bacterium]
MTVPTSYIELAGKLADIAGPIVARYFRSDLTIADKADASPVTAADREAEAAIRAVLEAECPDHGILGEEHGAENIEAEYVWVLDPIDGTKAFVTGKPLFGTLIALCQNGVPVLGVIDQPILKERWLGATGHPTTYNGEKISTRACSDLSEAWLYATSPAMFKGADEAAFNRLADSVKFPLYGADCYAYGLLASGFTDIVCEATMQPYDYCALVPVVEGAGGKMSDWAGKPLTLNADGRVLALGDATLQQAALDQLSR